MICLVPCSQIQVTMVKIFWNAWKFPGRVYFSILCPEKISWNQDISSKISWNKEISRKITCISACSNLISHWRSIVLSPPLPEGYLTRIHPIIEKYIAVPGPLVSPAIVVCGWCKLTPDLDPTPIGVTSYINKPSLVPIGLHLFKWGEFYILSQS